LSYNNINKTSYGGDDKCVKILVRKLERKRQLGKVRRKHEQILKWMLTKKFVRVQAVEVGQDRDIPVAWFS
jgi:hypothetical protein